MSLGRRPRVFFYLIGVLLRVRCFRQSDPPAHGVSDRVVGVLGGGQLGKMLCQAASQMGIKVAVLDPLENCPASSVCHEHVVGSFDDGDTVREFAKR
jgi:phosphoribosylaminoimidazole carboxylase